MRHSFGVTLALERDARDDRTFAHSRDARHARARLCRRARGVASRICVSPNGGDFAISPNGGDFAISPNGGDERFKTTRATRTTAETRARPLGDDGAR